MSSRKREECDICGKEYTKTNKSRHMKKHSDLDMGLSCRVCGKGFTQNYYLKRHIDAVHAEVKNHKCEVCDQVFSYTWQVKHHKSKEHGMGKRWECERCRKVFFIRCNFKAHVKICSDASQERVTCTMCRKTFKNNDSLRYHTRNVHINQGNYVCGVCRVRSFSRRSNLDRHIKTKKHEES